jgi:glycosyltransferase involved in cell wall biosynthesis
MWSPPADSLRIVTNMRYWQSAEWTSHVESIYDNTDLARHKELNIFCQASMLLRQRARADVILTEGVRESMAYGLLCLLTGRTSKQVMTEVFIDDPKKGPVWRLKNALYGVIARRAIGVLVNSRAEVDSISARYGVPRDRIRFVPLNSTLANEPVSQHDDGFILAAGRSLRDYSTLIEAAREIGMPLVIVCGREDAMPAELPPNISIRREVGYEEYLDLLRRCTFVALPLRATERATGQVVALEAMALGKPVVASRVAGTIDYIRDGETGLLVEPGNPDALRSALRRLISDPKLRARLAHSARAQIEANHSFDTHARAKLQAIRDLFERAHRPS